MLTLDAHGRPCYVNASGGPRSSSSSSSSTSIQPQRVVKERAASTNLPSTGNISKSVVQGAINSSSIPSTPTESPRSSITSVGCKSVLVPLSTNILANTSTNSSSSSSSNQTGYAANTSLTFVPPIKLQNQSSSTSSQSISMAKLPAVDDNDISRSKDSILMTEKLKSKVKELEKENDKLKSHVMQAEECIKNYRQQNNNNATQSHFKWPSKEVSCQTDNEGLDNSSLASARNSFVSNSLDANAVALIRLQSDNAKLLAIMDEYKSENRALNSSIENKDNHIAQLLQTIAELELNKAKYGDEALLDSNEDMFKNRTQSCNDSHNSIDKVSSNITRASSTNRTESEKKLNTADCLDLLHSYKRELKATKTEFENLLQREQKECCSGLLTVLAKINELNNNHNSSSKVKSPICSISIKSTHNNNNSNNNNISSLEKKIVELELELQHRLHDQEIAERTLRMITSELTQHRTQEERLILDIDELRVSLAQKDSLMNSMRLEADTRLDNEITKWKNARAKKIEANTQGCDPMTPLKAPFAASIEPSTEQLLAKEKEASRVLNSMIEELKSKLSISVEELIKLQDVHKKEMDALKHCAHVKDLGRIAQHREVSLERDKICSDLKHSREVANVLTCSLNTAEQSLSETQRDMVAKLIEGRTKRIKLIDRQTQDRSKDIDQRSLETCVVSSQHLEVFQKKANEKLRVASAEAEKLFESLKVALSPPSSSCV